MKASYKLLSLLTALAIMLAVFPVGGLVGNAAEIVDSGECGKNLIWSLDSNGLLKIQGNGTMPSYDTAFYEYTINEYGTTDMWNLVAEINHYDDPLPPWYDYRDIIQSVQLEKGITNVGDYAFYNCINLNEVSLADSVTIIGISAFDNCKMLSSVTIPESVTTISNGAFGSCTALVSINLPSNIKNVSRSSFENTGYYNRKENWEQGALYLSDILLDTDRDELPSHYSIREGTYCIAGGAISSNDNLLSVSIPNSVRFIGDSAFAYCNNLRTITIPESVETIGRKPFFRCYNLSEIIVDPGNNFYKNDAYGVLYNKENTELIRFPYGCECDNYSILPGVAVIHEYAFHACGHVKNIQLPDSVEVIDNCAFSDSSLKQIYIPENVMSIAYDSFSSTYQLERIDVDKNNKQYSSDEVGAFYDKDKTTLLKYPKECKATFYQIPDSVETIDSDAISYNNNLSTIIIPASIKNVWGCNNFSLNNLNAVYYTGNEVQWNQGIGIYIMGHLPKKTTVYYDFDPNEDNINRLISSENTTQDSNVGLDSKNPEKAVVNAEKKQITIQPGQSPDELKALLGDGVTVLGADGKELDAGKKVGTGAIVKTSDGAEYTIVVPGDTDGDGKVGAADARAALRASAKLSTLDGAFGKAADINADGKTKAADARSILRVAAKLDKITKDILAQM